MNITASGKAFLVLLAFSFLIGSCAGPAGTDREDFVGPRPLSPAAAAAAAAETAAAKEEVPPPAPAPPPEGPLAVRVEDAVLLALENNRSLKIEKLYPAIMRTVEDEERAAFDPLLSAGVSRFRERIDTPERKDKESLDNEDSAFLGLSEYLPTGTEIGVNLSTGRSWSDLYSDDFHGSRIGLSVTQAILRGAGIGYNLAALRQARTDTRMSLYELRGYAETLIAQVEESYWSHASAERQIDIFLESLRLAEQQKFQTEEMIRIGSLAESELAAAEAEIALRREGLINARSTLEKSRLQLLRLLNPPGGDLWDRKVTLLYEPKIPDVTLDCVDSHVDIALRMRPDLNQARLQAQWEDLEIVKTKNGLLPRMDFFIDLGKTGYAGSFGKSLDDLDGKSYDILTGFSLEYPLLNREARAKHRRSLLRREQAEEALSNMTQLVQVDVRSAWVEATRTKEQIAATRATRILQEEKERIETEKFRVGKSTTLLVGQAQRDLLSSRISEILAITNHLKALIELYRLEGSLLERRGIAAPGDVPGGGGKGP
ncbi:MAG TPA: TolC family protein [Syntrophales bacterium]|nr:TolC family protein [Syntrophales bacterium]HPX10929.1 TolC family protein [Syntrophales bacterium]HQB29404.1 TolC family protein [Syntrophales bacterium]HQN77094.1 TolC family protein [Syntrophales bacterium]HQQ26137.1 TolC family protein [Syntrophales bacterium]